jgi:hypothetical protein
VIDQLDDQIRGLLRQVAAQAPAAPELTHRESVSAADTRLVQPMALVDSSSRVSRRFVLRAGVGAAAAATLGGLVLIKNRPANKRPPTSPPQVSWQVVPDPDGVFKALPFQQRADNDIFVNVVGIRDVVWTSYGIFAVGGEERSDWNVAAIWRSDDGTAWTRVTHDNQEFGQFHDESVVVDGGFSMNAIAESEGVLAAVGDQFTVRQVANGIESQSQATFWISQDGETWSRGRFAVTKASPIDVAGGRNGFLAVGSINVNKDVTTGVAWYSPDGVNWSERSLPPSSGTRFGGQGTFAVAAIGDSFVVVGVDDGRATAWVTTDGRTWETAKMPDNIIDDPKISAAIDIAVSNGRLVVLGSVFSFPYTGPGWNQNGFIPPDGESKLTAWYSDDGRKWTRSDLRDRRSNNAIDLQGLAGGPNGFVAVARLIDENGFTNVTLTSGDGITWEISSSSLEGPRTAVTATPDGWIAVGDAIDYFPLGPNAQETLQLPRDASIWISR